MNNDRRKVLKDIYVRNIVPHPWQKTIKPIYSKKIKTAHNSITNPVYPRHEKKKVNLGRFKVIGIMTTKPFIYCSHLVAGISKYRPKIFDVPFIKGVTTTEWLTIQLNLKMQFGTEAYCLDGPVVVIYNDVLIGGEKELKQMVEEHYVYNVHLKYREEAEKNFESFVRSSGRSFTYMHIMIDDKHIGTLIFMLYNDIVPVTCENFLRLCNTKRGGYSGTPVHRIVKDCWIQCGGFGLKDTDLGFENHIVTFDRRGVVGMCNDGKGIDCSTQFFVTLQPMDWMNGKYIGFGQLVDGEETLKKIESISTYYESPESAIIIFDAGILNLQSKRAPINKNTLEYLNEHLEDLVNVGEYIVELLLEYVWVAIGMAELKIVMESKSSFRTSSSSRSKYRSDPWPMLSDTSKANLSRRFNKENLLAVEMEYKENNAAEDHSDSESEIEEIELSKISLPSEPVKPLKPFHIPFTDVPYPGEVSSEYDLKKLLKGYYCLEGDLEVALPKNAKEHMKIILYYSELPSETMLFDNISSFDNESLSLSPSEEYEINEYIRNNVARVSFAPAGGIINEISKGHAMLSLFEGRKKSDLESLEAVTEDELQKMRAATLTHGERYRLKSEIKTLRDEDVRILKNTTDVFQRLIPNVNRRKSTKTTTTTDGVEDENTVLVRVDSRKKRQTIFDPETKVKHFERDSVKSTAEDRKMRVTLPDEAVHEGKIRRRATGFVRSDDMKKMLTEEELQEMDELRPETKERNESVEEEQAEVIDIFGSKLVLQKLAKLASQSQIQEEKDIDFSRAIPFSKSLPKFGEMEVLERSPTLARLLNEVTLHDDDDEPPTLKDYKTFEERASKHYLLTASKKFDSKELLEESDQSLMLIRKRKATGLQKISFKKLLPNARWNSERRMSTISDDYVAEIIKKQNQLQSISVINEITAPRRRQPTLTVQEYQAKCKELLEKEKKEQEIKNAVKKKLQRKPHK